MKIPSKRLILIRHAHRDKKLDRDTDNGLSLKGRKQARKLGFFFKEQFGTRANPRFLSSPKRRCLETLAPISETMKPKGSVETDSRLDEGDGLHERVAVFLKSWQNSRAVLTVACTHGDWIPEALRQICGGSIELEKGGWVEVRNDDGQPRIHSLLQEP